MICPANKVALRYIPHKLPLLLGFWAGPASEQTIRSIDSAPPTRRLQFAILTQPLSMTCQIVVSFPQSGIGCF